jgi:hypothetical protein
MDETPIERVRRQTRERVNRLRERRRVRCPACGKTLRSEQAVAAPVLSVGGAVAATGLSPRAPEARGRREQPAAPSAGGNPVLARFLEREGKKG